MRVLALFVLVPLVLLTCASSPAPREAGPSVDEDPVHASSLNRDMVHGVVQTKREAMIACYEDGLRADATLRGRLVMRWTIRADGVVTEASVAQSNLTAEVEPRAFYECMIEAVLTMEFPPVFQESRLHYPFIFEPPSDDSEG